MSSWSAWNVTGNVSSEVLRVLMDIQNTLLQLQTSLNNKVTKGGDQGTLSLGTKTFDNIHFLTNNTVAATLATDGSFTAGRYFGYTNGSNIMPTFMLPSNLGFGLGIYTQTKNDISLAVETEIVAKLTKTVEYIYKQLSVITGSETAPSICGADADTGIYFPSSTVCVTSNGLKQVEIADLYTSFNNQLRVTEGTSAAPSIRNNTDTDTGIYFPTTTSVGISTNGTKRIEVSDDATSVVNQLRIPDNAGAITPGIGFNSETGLGMQRTNTGEITFLQNNQSTLIVQPDRINIPTQRLDFATGGPYLQHTGNQFKIDTQTHQFSLTVKSQPVLTAELNANDDTLMTVDAKNNKNVIINNTSEKLVFQKNGIENMSLDENELILSGPRLKLRPFLSDDCDIVWDDGDTVYDTGIYTKGPWMFPDDSNLTFKVLGTDTLSMKQDRVVNPLPVVLDSAETIALTNDGPGAATFKILPANTPITKFSSNKIQVSGTGTAATPQYTFINKSNTGVFLSNDGYLTMSQDGNQVFRCFSTGVDMTADQIFFDTQTGPTYYPQICWDSAGSRDTGIYSKGDGVITFRNNNVDGFTSSDNFIGHSGMHNQYHGTIDKLLPNLHSTAYNVVCTIDEYTNATITTSYASTLINMRYHRVGNIVNFSGQLYWPITSTCTGLGISFVAFYTQHNPVATNANKPGTVPAVQYYYPNYSGTITVTNNSASITNVVAAGNLEVIVAGTNRVIRGQAHHKTTAGPQAFPYSGGSTLYAVNVSGTYEINI